METMNQSGPLNSPGTHASLVVLWCLCISCSCETGNFDFLSNILPTPIAPQNDRNLNQGILHLWSEFGDHSLNRTGHELWCRQTQKGVNLEFYVEFDLEVQGRFASQNNKVLNQGLFRDPSLNGWWVIVRTSSWLTHRRTHGQADWPRVTKISQWSIHVTDVTICNYTLSIHYKSKYSIEWNRLIIHPAIMWYTRAGYW